MNCYWWNRNNNCGDLCAPIVYEYFSGKNAVYSDHGPRYLIIGSILHKADDGDVIWGIGAKDSRHISRNLTFHMVRGPLTRKVLLDQGYKVPQIYADPAIFIPSILKIEKDPIVDFGVVPHFMDYDLAKNLGLNPIDILSGVRKVVLEMSKCKLIYSSSLHGIILSEAMGIPAVYVEFQKNRSRFKYYDYQLGTGRQIKDPIDWTSSLKFSGDWEDPVFDWEGAISSCPFNFMKRSLDD